MMLDNISVSRDSFIGLALRLETDRHAQQGLTDEWGISILTQIFFELRSGFRILALSKKVRPGEQQGAPTCVCIRIFSRYFYQGSGRFRGFRIVGFAIRSAGCPLYNV